MAERRMFSKRFAFSDSFLDLPVTSQCLYFHLCLQADDEGFLENARVVRRFIRAGEQDFRLLVDGGLLLEFPSGVCAITHWHVHNHVRPDRRHPTSFVKERSQVTLENDVYVWLTDGNQVTTEDRIGEVRVGEDSLGQVSSGFNQSKTTGVRESDLAPDGSPATDTAPQDDALLTAPTAVRSCLQGELGQGVVMLSEEQMDSLLSMMSLDEFDHYVKAVARCELAGKKFTHKTHYQAILDMVRADRAYGLTGEGG